MAVSTARGVHEKGPAPLKITAVRTQDRFPGVMTQILIADDHEVVRQGVRVLLEANPDWTVCCEAATGRGAVAKAREFPPEGVVLAIPLPGSQGLAAARK